MEFVQIVVGKGEPKMFQKQINYSNKDTNQIFAVFFNNKRKNFLYRRRKKNYLIEVSKEKSFLNEIYTITILELKPHNRIVHRGDLSQCFSSLEEVEIYIKSL